jgi:hypothetical protein
MPIRNNNRRRGAAKVASRAQRELTPFAVMDRPPRDPPIVNSNPKKKLVLDLFFAVQANAVTRVILLSELRTQLLEQVGLATNSQNILVDYVHAWVQGSTATSALSVTSSSASLRLVDPVFAIESRDDASPEGNARCGFRYPKNVARFLVYNAPANTPVASFQVSSAAGVTTGVTVRVGVVYWGLTTS